MRKRWSYVEKKSKYPEKVSDCQDTLPITEENGIKTKGTSPIPVIGSFGGMIFSGAVFGNSEAIIFLIVASLVNIIYYGRPMLKMFFDFLLKYKEQKYDQSISKTEANEQERKMRQMELDHAYRMKELELQGGNSYKLFNSSVIPPANVAEEQNRYLS